MNIKQQIEEFEKNYRAEERELLFLIGDASGGAAKTGEALWMAQAFFLAYADAGGKGIRPGEGRLVWPLSENDREKHGSDYPYFFKKGCVYRLRVRELIDKTVPDGRAPSFYNRFLVVKVLEEGVENDALSAIIE